MASPSKPPVRDPRTRQTTRAIAVLAAMILAAGGILLDRHYEANKPFVPAPVPVADTVAPKPEPTPFTKRHLYSETDDPHAEVAAGIAKARAEHKRVILDFGGDWCGDCQVLDIYLHQPPNLDLLEKNFVVVHVFIGQIDKNLDIPESYGIAIHKGVPALAVLDDHGKLIYAQKTGEFENMRNMSVQSVTDFLTKWKA